MLHGLQSDHGPTIRSTILEENRIVVFAVCGLDLTSNPGLVCSQGSNEPCYINVLSWIKISTPRKPEDPIPLYGGMRIPCSSTVPVEKKSFQKRQPTTFAVMANPEILRLSGKSARDPMVISVIMRDTFVHP
jgi:hypothetical protein